MGDRAQAAWQGEAARVTSGRSVARPAESAARRNGILVTAPKRPAGLRPRAPASARPTRRRKIPPRARCRASILRDRIQHEGAASPHAPSLPRCRADRDAGCPGRCRLPWASCPVRSRRGWRRWRRNSAMTVWADMFAMVATLWPLTRIALPVRRSCGIAATTGAGGWSQPGFRAHMAMSVARFAWPGGMAADECPAELDARPRRPPWPSVARRLG